MNRKRLITYLVISLLILIGGSAWVISLRNGLVIPGKTNALYSLETAWTKERVSEVLSLWQDRLDLVWKLNTIDFIIPVAYTAFFYFSICLLAQVFPALYGKNKKWWLIISFLPGVFDLIEGIAAYIWLSGHIDNILPWLVGLLSSIKFIIAIPLGLFIIISLIVATIKKPRKLPGSNY